jgi:hypothetical protein
MAASRWSFGSPWGSLTGSRCRRRSCIYCCSAGICGSGFSGSSGVSGPFGSGSGTSGAPGSGCSGGEGFGTSGPGSGAGGGDGGGVVGASGGVAGPGSGCSGPGGCGTSASVGMPLLVPDRQRRKRQPVGTGVILRPTGHVRDSRAAASPPDGCRLRNAGAPEGHRSRAAADHDCAACQRLHGLGSARAQRVRRRALRPSRALDPLGRGSSRCREACSRLRGRAAARARDPGGLISGYRFRFIWTGIWSV